MRRAHTLVAFSAIVVILAGVTASQAHAARRVQEYPVDPRGWGITTGPDRALWYTDTGDTISRITTDGTVTYYPMPDYFNEVWLITTGPDGNLWFTESNPDDCPSNGNAIGRITPDGVIIEYQIPENCATAWGITAGPDGNLWFTQAQASFIGRITTDGVITEFPTRGARSGRGHRRRPRWRPVVRDQWQQQDRPDHHRRDCQHVP